MMSITHSVCLSVNVSIEKLSDLPKVTECEPVVGGQGTHFHRPRTGS